MQKAILAAAVLAFGACSNFDPTGPTPTELYAMVCVDSTAVHPTYNCANPPVSIVEITIVVDNPLK